MKTTNLFSVRGRVGQPPKSFHGAVKIRIATDRHWTDASGEKHADTDWVTITVLNERSVQWALAHIAVGDAVYAECRIAENQFKNRDGEMVYATDIIAHVLNKLETGSRADASQ